MTTAQSTKGKRGFGTGAGRKKGVPNKRTQEAKQILAAHGLNTLEEAIKVYRGEILFPVMIAVKKGKPVMAEMPASPKERIRCLIECIKRDFPELRSIELEGETAKSFVDAFAAAMNKVSGNGTGDEL